MRLLVLGLAALLSFPACEKDRPDEADWELQRHYQLGNQALGEGSLEAAEREYRRVLKSDSSHVGAMHKLARTLMEKARRGMPPPGPQEALDEAVQLLQRAAKLDPEDRLVFLELARAYREAGQAQKALETCARLIELKPTDLNSRLMAAEILEQQGDPDRAEKAYLEALQKCSEPGELKLAYGRFLVRQQRDPDAKKQFSSVPQTSPAFYEALDELGAMAAREGKHDEVRRIYRRLVEINPNDYMAWELLAALDENQKKYSEAEKKYRRSLQADRMHLSAWLGLGRTLRLQGRREEATYALRKADGFLATNPDRVLELSWELAALGDAAWAASVLERAKIVVTDQKLLAAIEKRLKELRAKKKP
jgi:Tfp pilus assembly protein PilF